MSEETSKSGEMIFRRSTLVLLVVLAAVVVLGWLSGSSRRLGLANAKPAEIFTFGLVGLLALISFIADLCTIGTTLHAVILKRRYEHLALKIFTIMILFFLSLFFLQVARAGKVGYLISLDGAVHVAGVSYFVLSAASVSLVSYILFKYDYSDLDYLYFVLIFCIPFFLGLVVNGILFGKREFLGVSVAFLFAALFQGILIAKNYVVDRMFERGSSRGKAAHGTVVGPTKSPLRFFDGRNCFQEPLPSYFAREFLVVLIACAMGFSLLVINHGGYRQSLGLFFSANVGLFVFSVAALALILIGVLRAVAHSQKVDPVEVGRKLTRDFVGTFVFKNQRDRRSEADG